MNALSVHEAEGCMFFRNVQNQVQFDSSRFYGGTKPARLTAHGEHYDESLYSCIGTRDGTRRRHAVARQCNYSDWRQVQTKYRFQVQRICSWQCKYSVLEPSTQKFAYLGKKKIPPHPYSPNSFSLYDCSSHKCMGKPERVTVTGCGRSSVRR